MNLKTGVFVLVKFNIQLILLCAIGWNVMVLEAYQISAKYKTHALTNDMKLLTKVIATQLER
jgi:hypothetical protein